MKKSKIEYALDMVEALYKNDLITRMEFWEIEGGFMDIAGGQIARGIAFLEKLDPKPRRISFEILATVGMTNLQRVAQ